MALLGPNIDYSDKDFDALRARLINLVRSAFPDWTDFNVANFGNILLELFAFVGDVLTFYMDNQGRESRIVTAQLRKSLLGLAKLIGFEAAGAEAATAEITFTLTAVPVGDVDVLVGDTFRTLEITDPIVFQAIAAATILGGTSPPVALVQVENSLNRQQVFASVNLPNQEFVLDNVPFLDASVSITATDGVYTEVDDFLSSTSTDRHFTVTVDENDRATVRFGNGINGTIPQGTITINYKTGGGVVGNVVPGAIARADKSYVDSFATPVQVTVANANAASGGTNRATIEQIRQDAPRSLRVLNRTVAREDYEINAKKITGVARALMLTSNERPAIDENAGQLHIVPDGGGLPTQTLKDDVLTQVTVTFPNTLTFIVSVVDPEFLTINVQATVFLAQGQTASVVDTRIRTNLAAFFALDNADGSENALIDFGFNFQDVTGSPTGEIALSDVFNVVRDTTGVRKIGDQAGDFVLNGENSDVTIAVQEFPQLGTVTLIDGDTNLPLGT